MGSFSFFIGPEGADRLEEEGHLLDEAGIIRPIALTVGCRSLCKGVFKLASRGKV